MEYQTNKVVIPLFWFLDDSQAREKHKSLRKPLQKQKGGNANQTGRRGSREKWPDSEHVMSKAEVIY